MSNSLQSVRLNFDEVVAKSNGDGDVKFTDPMNEFIDLMINKIEGEEWREVGATGEPAFENSWVSFDADRALSFKLIGNVLYLKGAVKSGSSATANIFTLPDGYRVSANRIVASYTSAGFAPLLFQADGSVSILSGGSTTFTYVEAVIPL